MVKRIVCSMTTGFDRLQRACTALRGIELVPTDSEQDTAAALRGAAGLVTFAGRYTAPVAMAVDRSGLEWLHLVTAGVDPLIRYPPPARVRLSSGGRVWSAAVAEHAVTLLLAVQHGIHLAERHRAVEAWSRPHMMEAMRVIRHLDVLLVGFGDVGRRIARLLKPFDVDLKVVARNARQQDGLAVRDTARLPSLISGADAVIVAVPLSPSTTGLIGSRELRAMKADAVLIDVSRGGVVDPDALLAALGPGGISGAGLDVFATEPLPENHPLWRFPNVILTPHVAGFGDPRALDEMAAICRGNMEDFIAGRDLRDGFTM